MQPVLKNNLSSIWEEHINTPDSLSTYLVWCLGKTGTYEGLSVNNPPMNKAHSLFGWAENHGLEFRLVNKTKKEFGQESTFITNFITNQN